MEARENLGSTTYESLFSGKHELDTSIVTIASGKAHKRGEILGVKDGKCEILGTSGYTASYILAEDVDASSGDVEAVAYKSGGFIKNKLIVDDSYTLTGSDVDTLRNAGIYLENAQL